MAGGERPASPIGTRAVERFLRRSFGLAGSTVADQVRGDVAPSIDVRPLLPWEFRDFGIVPFWQTNSIALLAGEHSYMEIGPILSLPMDVVVTEIRANAGAAIRIRAASVGDIAADAVQSRDSTFGFGTALSGGAAWIVTGTATFAALAAGSSHVWQLAANETCPVPVIIRQGSGGFVTIQNDTIAQAIIVSIAGFLVPVNVATA